MIHRLQALRLYEYKSLEPKWELLFAFKHPWSDVTALKPSWTRASRPPPPPDAHPSSLKTEADFPDEVAARAERAKKRQLAKERKLARESSAIVTTTEGEVGEGPSAVEGKRKKKPAQRPKKLVVISPPAASSNDGDRNEEEDIGADADDESVKASPVVEKAPKSKPAQKAVKVDAQESVPASRPTIDTTNIVLDPPLASAPPVSNPTKPSAQEKAKSVADPEEKETLAERKARKAAEANAAKEKEMENYLMQIYAATPSNLKADIAKQLGIEHLVAASADAKRRLEKAAEAEKVAADAAAQLEKVPASVAAK